MLAYNTTHPNLSVLPSSTNITLLTIILCSAIFVSIHAPPYFTAEIVDIVQLNSSGISCYFIISLGVGQG